MNTTTATGKSLPSAASLQNLHSLASKPKVRQRTMSHTTVSHKDHLLRSSQQATSPVQSYNDINQAEWTKPNVSTYPEDGSRKSKNAAAQKASSDTTTTVVGNQRTRTLRSAASHASLREKPSRKPASDTSPKLGATTCGEKPTNKKGGRASGSQKIQAAKICEERTYSASPNSTSSYEGESSNDSKATDQDDTDLSSDSSQTCDLNILLEKERATIQVLQRQKEGKLFARIRCFLTLHFHLQHATKTSTFSVRLSIL